MKLAVASIASSLARQLFTYVDIRIMPATMIATNTTESRRWPEAGGVLHQLESVDSAETIEAL
jgi:hypothetical protein